MDGVGVAVGAEFFDFHSPCCITAVFAGGIARNPRRSLVGVCPTLGTL